MAHFDASATDATKLESGYIDGSGTFQPVQGSALGTAFGEGKVLYSTLDVTITIDFTQKKSTGVAGWDTENNYFYDEDGVPYLKSSVVTDLASDSPRIWLKADTSKDGKLFTDKAMTGDPFYFIGSTPANKDEDSALDADKGWLFINGTTAMAGFDASTGFKFENVTKYYIYGGATGTPRNDAGKTIAGIFTASIDHPVV